MLGQRAQAGQRMREMVVDRDDDAGARHLRDAAAAPRTARTAPRRARRAACRRRPARGPNCIRTRAQLARQPRVCRLVQPRRIRPSRAREQEPRIGRRTTCNELRLTGHDGRGRGGRGVCARLAAALARTAIVASRARRLAGAVPVPAEMPQATCPASITTKTTLDRTTSRPPVAPPPADMGPGGDRAGARIPDPVHAVPQPPGRANVSGSCAGRSPRASTHGRCMLRPGLAMDSQTLKTELDAASYRDDGAGVRPGTYQHNGGRWRIASRGFHDVDGMVGPSRIEVQLSVAAASPACATWRAAERSSRRGWIRRASPRCTGRSRKSAASCASRKSPNCWSPACRRSRTATSPTTTASICRRHAARRVRHRALGRREQAGRQHAHPAARAQRPARHRPEQTVTRKFKEILYALLIEARYDKRTILETYLNQVYLGQRGSQEIRGVAAGAGILVRPRPARPAAPNRSRC